jgi:hypothetical protein
MCTVAAATAGTALARPAAANDGTLNVAAREFLSSHPGSGVNQLASGRIDAVYGAAFSNGQSAGESAQVFVVQSSTMFGVGR